MASRHGKNSGRFPHDSGSAAGEESFLVRFAREYGWRAYAIPVLVVITAWLLVDIVNDGSVNFAQSTTGSKVSQTASSRGPGPDPATMNPAQLPITELPSGGAYATSGTHEFRVIGRPGAQAGKGDEMVVRYVVQAEIGVDTSRYGGDDAVASMIDATLTDPRGWTHDPAFRFEHVSVEDEPNLYIRIASTHTTKQLCGAEDFEMETSCRTTGSGDNEVIINDSRWTRGAHPFEGDIGSYRQYLINHEVGHAIGYANHVPCGGDGELAPIMMQQTLSLNNSELAAMAPEEVYPDNHATCRFNSWPYPVPGGDVVRPGKGE